MNEWQDRDRWGNDRWRNDDDDEYQRRRHAYDEGRDHWRSSDPRYGGRGRSSYGDRERPGYEQRSRGERSSEYSSLPGIGTNYGGGGWMSEYAEDARRYSERPGYERMGRASNPREGWQDPRRDSQSGYGSRYGGEYQDPYRRNYGRGLDVGEDYGQRYGRGGGDSERGWWERTKDEVRSWMGDEDAERRRQADHYGRGPKGYTRSDDRIRDDVSDRLMEDWEVDATDIEVAVASGEVTLTGTVGDRASKRRAENIAANVLGVKDVQNNLRVRKIDPFATGREVGAMTQGSNATTPSSGSTATGTTGTGSTSGTTTGTSPQTKPPVTPHH